MEKLKKCGNCSSYDDGECEKAGGHFGLVLNFLSIITKIGLLPKTVKIVKPSRLTNRNSYDIMFLDKHD